MGPSRSGRIMTDSIPGSLALAERNVPRYTSYPSAPHFSARIGPDTYRDWLAALPRAARVSLYLHVPFCTELCFYCGCNTRAVRKRAPVDTYAEQLIAEIALLGDLNGARLNAVDPRSAMAGDDCGQDRFALRPERTERTRHRTRSAPARSGAGGHAESHRRQPRESRHAGCFAACAARHRPGAAFR